MEHVSPQVTGGDQHFHDVPVFLREIADAIPSPAVLMSADDQVAYLNPAARPPIHSAIPGVLLLRSTVGEVLPASAWRRPNPDAPLLVQFGDSSRQFLWERAVQCPNGFVLGVLRADWCVHTELEALRLDRIYEAQVLAAVPSIFVGVRRDGVVTHWNEAAGRAFGLEAEATIGKPFLDLPIRW